MNKTLTDKVLKSMSKQELHKLLERYCNYLIKLSDKEIHKIIKMKEGKQ